MRIRTFAPLVVSGLVLAMVAGGTGAPGAAEPRRRPLHVTRPVTVTVPQGPAPFVVDSFGRTVTNGLGTADVGGTWTTAGAATDFAAGSDAAALTLRTASTQLSAWLGVTTRTDTGLRATFAVDKVATGSVYLDVAGRRERGNEYRARVALLRSGEINIGLTALRSGAGTVVAADRRATGVT
jgi:hypothetical protein